MKLRKAIKKIVALGIGASMVGATILSASAADLNDYPAPFIQNGKFSGTLVVGDNAAAEDVIGVSDIAMSLQFASSVKTGSGATSTTTVEGDAWRIASTGDDLNLYQNLTSLKSGSLGEGDLNALAAGSFNAKSTETYKQKLYVGKGSGTRVEYDTYDEISEDPALYLRFEKDQELLHYELDFDTAIESDVDSNGKLEDFEDQKITILGKEYTILQAKNSTDKLTFMAGAVQDTMEVGETKTYTIDGKDYE
ncbi:S-layer protein, partial [Candidatus Woesearchaeota archaeon]|nr:S-layer protein [Candidatus Woesearchaeota archaeon]